MAVLDGLGGPSYRTSECGRVRYRGPLPGQGKSEEAATCYERAVEIDPKLVPVLLRLAVVHIMGPIRTVRHRRGTHPYPKGLCRDTHREPDVLGILAGGYPAGRQHGDAASTTRKARKHRYDRQPEPGRSNPQTSTTLRTTPTPQAEVIDILPGPTSAANPVRKLQAHSDLHLASRLSLDFGAVATRFSSRN